MVGKTVHIMVRLNPGPAEFRHDNVEPVCKREPALHSKELDVAAVENRVLVWRTLRHEDRSDLRQRPRILKQERIAHRRDEAIKAVVTLERAAAIVEPERIAHL